MIIKNENFEIGYLFNNAFVDPNNVSRNLKWLVDDIKEESAIGDYNLTSDGKFPHLGRIYVNEDDAKACITKVGNSSAYFIVQIPKDNVSGTFVDPLDERIQYFNVKEETVPEVVGLSTSFGQYQITPQYDCMKISKEYDCGNVVKERKDIEIENRDFEQNSVINEKQRPISSDLPLHNLVRLR